MKLDEFRRFVLPSLAEKHQTREGLTKAIGAFLKQEGEDAVETPVVNEDGSPVQVEQIILVGAPASDEAPMDEEEAAPGAASVTTLSASDPSVKQYISDAVDSALKSTPRPVIKTPMAKSATEEVKTFASLPATVKKWGAGRLKCFKGKGVDGSDAEFRAYGFHKWLQSRLAPDDQDRLDAREWCKSRGIGRKAMSEGVNSAGGALVPEEYLPDLIRLVEEYGVFRGAAQTVPMARDTLLIPRRTGGVTATFTGENTAITESNPTYDNVQLTAQKLATLTRVSSELMADAAISVGDQIATEIALSFATKEDDCGFNGDGTSTYGGMVGLTTIMDDGNHGGGLITQATDTVTTWTLASFHTAIGTLPRYAHANAKWYCHNAIFANSMQRLSAAQGGVTWRETTSGQPEMMFLGYPVELTTIMNSTITAESSVVKVLFGDIAMASSFGDRAAMEIASSEHRYFDQDQMAIRGIERFDIANHDLGDSSTAGPVVAIQSAS